MMTRYNASFIGHASGDIVIDFLAWEAHRVSYIAARSRKHLVGWHAMTNTKETSDW